MNRQTAENLVARLSAHPRIVVPDRDLFLGILLDADVPLASPRFYEILPDTRQLVEETGRYHYLSLRRVLRNYNAERYRLSKPEQVYEAFVSAIGAHSSDALSRRLRSDEDLVRMMSESKHPFSLLGKLQTYDYGNPEEDLFVVTKPILVIPDVSDTAKICAWEDDNTTYEQEVGLFFLRHPKRIRPETYLSR